MKPLTLLILFCTTVVFTFGQNEKKIIFYLDEFKPSEKISLPFSYIKIIDARYDQINVGCLSKDLSFKGRSKKKMLAVFPQPLTTYLPFVLNNLVSLDAHSPDTLLLLIKQFRIADYVKNTPITSTPTQSVFTFSASFFSLKNLIINKIFSVEDDFAEPWSIEDSAERSTNFFRAKAISVLLSRFLQNKDWHPNPQSFTYAEVEKSIQKRMTIPLFTDSILVSGVYKTFEEFKNNKPSFSDGFFGMYDHELKSVKDRNNSLLDLNNFWGACDGVNKYIIVEGEFYKLEQIDKSFRIIGTRLARSVPRNNTVYYHDTPLLVPNLTHPSGNIYELEYLYLNMDSGQLYMEEINGLKKVPYHRPY